MAFAALASMYTGVLARVRGQYSTQVRGVFDLPIAPDSSTGSAPWSDKSKSTSSGWSERSLNAQSSIVISKGVQGGVVWCGVKKQGEFE
jgi:hypothetical protein